MLAALDTKWIKSESQPLPPSDRDKKHTPANLARNQHPPSAAELAASAAMPPLAEMVKLTTDGTPVKPEANNPFADHITNIKAEREKFSYLKEYKVGELKLEEDLIKMLGPEKRDFYFQEVEKKNPDIANKLKQAIFRKVDPKELRKNIKDVIPHVDELLTKLEKQDEKDIDQIIEKAKAQLTTCKSIPFEWPLDEIFNHEEIKILCFTYTDKHGIHLYDSDQGIIECIKMHGNHPETRAPLAKKDLYIVTDTDYLQKAMKDEINSLDTKLDALKKLLKRRRHKTKPPAAAVVAAPPKKPSDDSQPSDADLAAIDTAVRYANDDISGPIKRKKKMDPLRKSNRVSLEKAILEAKRKVESRSAELVSVSYSIKYKKTNGTEGCSEQKVIVPRSKQELDNFTMVDLPLGESPVFLVKVNGTLQALSHDGQKKKKSPNSPADSKKNPPEKRQLASVANPKPAQAAPLPIVLKDKEPSDDSELSDADVAAIKAAVKLAREDSNKDILLYLEVAKHKPVVFQSTSGNLRGCNKAAFSNAMLEVSRRCSLSPIRINAVSVNYTVKYKKTDGTIGCSEQKIFTPADENDFKKICNEKTKRGQYPTCIVQQEGSRETSEQKAKEKRSFQAQSNNTAASLSNSPASFFNGSWDEEAPACPAESLDKEPTAHP